MTTHGKSSIEKRGKGEGKDKEEDERQRKIKLIREKK